MAIHAVDITVTGRVQGVFFRSGCREQADRLGVRGWVSNEPDGSVAGHFEGEDQDVQALVDWCRTGSRAARVDDLTVSPSEVRQADGFETR